MNIAIIGAGISGLTAAYLLRHAHNVEVFERGSQAGGHANTVVAHDPEVGEVPLDVGFIVFNEPTYPGFTRLLGELGVETQRSDMSFGVRCESDDFEYSSRGIRGALAQPRNLFKPAYQRMILEIFRFHRDARRVLREDTMHDISFAEYLQVRGFGRAFRERMIVPLLASTWSNSPKDILEFPAHYLFRFLEQHGVLARNRIPEWRWVTGGSRSYVSKLIAALPEGAVHLGTPVRSVCREEGGATLAFMDGSERRFDAVVLACHSDEARCLLADPADWESEALDALRYAPNQVVLHTDASILPRSPWAEASWNYHSAAGARYDEATLTMTYDLNRLQGLRSNTHYLVSVNPGGRIDPARVLARFDYAHPVYSVGTLKAQQVIEVRNGERRTYYAGAYLGYGFHEDGLQAGVRVARALGVEW